jgi:hypothetical protein
MGRLSRTPGCSLKAIDSSLSLKRYSQSGKSPLLLFPGFIVTAQSRCLFFSLHSAPSGVGQTNFSFHKLFCHFEIFS